MRPLAGALIGALAAGGIWLVKPVVDELVDDRRVEYVQKGRRYEDRVLRLAPPSLL